MAKPSVPFLLAGSLLFGCVLPTALAEELAVSDESKTVGIGNTNTTFVENGVDKSPIRGLNADGTRSSKGLGDDASFKPPSYFDTLQSDPACAKAGARWIELRHVMTEVYADQPLEYQEDMAAIAALEFFNQWNMRHFTHLDKLSDECFLGVVSVIYHIARHRALVESNYQSGVALCRSLDRQMATIHPDKFDAANKGPDGRPIWPVSDFLVSKLQRDIAVMSRGMRYDHNCGSKSGCVNGSKPLHGNLFNIMGNDTLPIPQESGMPGESDPSEKAVRVEDAFKIYVYDVAEHEELVALTAGLAFCKENQWGFEVLLHLYFLACDCRTDDPDEADFFFVPHYTACHLNVKTFDEEGSEKLFASLIPKLRYFRRTGGRDHLFVWGGGFSVDGPFRSWRQHIEHSIFLMTETEFWNPYDWQTEPSFQPSKDIVLPGRISISEIKQHNDMARSMDLRQYTGDFVGWNRPLHRAQGTAESPRQRLLKWAAVHEDMHIRQDVPYQEALLGSVNSKFCFVPRGKSAWSSRLFRVLFGKCVPVLLNDDYLLPFTSVFPNLDWFVSWPMRNVSNEFAEQLRSYKVDQLERMVANAEDIRCWYVWTPSTIDTAYYDLQLGNLDDVCPDWRTKNAYLVVMFLLSQKKRVSKSSSGTFYMPAGHAQSPYHTLIDSEFRSL